MTRTLWHLALHFWFAVVSACYGGEPMALTSLGSFDQTKKIGGNSAAAQGYVAWANTIGPQLEGRYKRLMAKNPFGQWKVNLTLDPNGRPDSSQGVTHDMWLAGPLLAGLTQPKWYSIAEFREAHRLLTEKYGLEEVCYYVGGPDNTPENLWDECIEPFVGLDKISLGLDFTCMAKHVAAHNRFVTLCRAQGYTGKFYIEARAYPDVRVGDFHEISGSIASHNRDTQQGPQASIDFERACSFGEVLRSYNSEADETAGKFLDWPPHVTRQVRNWQ